MTSEGSPTASGIYRDLPMGYGEITKEKLMIR
jgi:hypothetical protein